MLWLCYVENERWPLLHGYMSTNGRQKLPDSESAKMKLNLQFSNVCIHHVCQWPPGTVPSWCWVVWWHAAVGWHSIVPAEVIFIGKKFTLQCCDKMLKGERTFCDVFIWCIHNISRNVWQCLEVLARALNCNKWSNQQRVAADLKFWSFFTDLGNVIVDLDGSRVLNSLAKYTSESRERIKQLIIGKDSSTWV